MIKEVKTVQVVPDGKTPSLDDILKAKRIAIKSHCVVDLQWTIKCGGLYNIIIDEDSDIEAKYNGLPKVYGV